MGGSDSEKYKYYKIKPKQYPEIVRQLEAGESYQTIGNRYGVTREAIRLIARRFGKVSIWKLKFEKYFQGKKSLILKRLSEEPNIRKIVKEFGLSVGVVKSKRLTQTKEYLDAKKRLKDERVCNECGALLKGNQWQRVKLCYDCGRIKNAITTNQYVMHRYYLDLQFRKKILARNIQWRHARKKRLSEST